MNQVIYRTLLLNKVCAQGSGEARRSAVRLTKRKSMQRFAVKQRNLQCIGYPVSRSRESNHILYCRDYKKQNNNKVNISHFVIK